MLLKAMRLDEITKGVSADVGRRRAKDHAWEHPIRRSGKWEQSGGEAETSRREKQKEQGFPGGPVVKNLPSNSGGMGSTPGRGTKIPRAEGQLSLCIK